MWGPNYLELAFTKYLELHDRDNGHFYVKRNFHSTLDGQRVDDRYQRPLRP